MHIEHKDINHSWQKFGLVMMVQFSLMGNRQFDHIKGMACKIKPFCTSGKAEHPPTTHLPGIFRARDLLCAILSRTEIPG